MMHSRLLATWLVAVPALGSVACAAPTSILRPQSVPPEHGAIFGHVRVSNGSADVTDRCGIEFTDHKERRKAYVLPDAKGWVFITVDRGLTYLSAVNCSLGTFSGAYNGRDLRFSVPGEGKIVYFGHVNVDLNARGPTGGQVAAAVILGGAALAAAAIASTNFAEAPTAHVDDRLAQATAEFRSRYGSDASLLQPIAAIAGETSSTSATPETFSLGKDIRSAEAACTSASHEWLKVDDTHTLFLQRRAGQHRHTGHRRLHHVRGDDL